MRAVAPGQLVQDIQRAENAGLDFSVISDHFQPWPSAQGHCGYAWSILGAAAQATQRIGLMSYVTCPTLRYHPAIVARPAGPAIRYRNLHRRESRKAARADRLAIRSRAGPRGVLRTAPNRNAVAVRDGAPVHLQVQTVAAADLEIDVRVVRVNRFVGQRPAKTRDDPIELGGVRLEGRDDPGLPGGGSVEDEMSPLAYPACLGLTSAGAEGQEAAVAFDHGRLG